jgi:asparagine synthase (glutamine-hydrolysing)
VYRELRLSKPVDYVEHFQGVFKAAVSDRLRTTSVGIHMSGGLDSSLIAATAHHLLSRRGLPFELRAHTVVHDKLFSDPERHFASLVAASLSMPIDYLVADDFQLLDERAGWRDRFPEPDASHSRPGFIDSSNEQLATHTRVALTGWDGDALLHCSWRAHLGSLWRNHEFGTFAADSIRYARVKHNLLGAITRRLRRPTGVVKSPPPYPTWLNPGFEQRLSLKERWTQVHAAEVPARASLVNPAREGAYELMAQPNWRPLLEGFDPGVTGVPLEFRHPLLDLRVVECALSLPAIPWCVDKHIFRAAGQKMLPEAILRRPKTPLQGDPVRIAIQHYMARASTPFVLHPNLGQYIDTGRISVLIDEIGSEAYSGALRVLIMNHWLSQ